MIKTYRFQVQEGSKRFWVEVEAATEAAALAKARAGYGRTILSPAPAQTPAPARPETQPEKFNILTFQADREAARQKMPVKNFDILALPKSETDWSLYQ